MQDTKQSIIRKYKRKSKSPFKGDDSTILLLANISANANKIVLGYDRYIYLHRDDTGRWLGISLSKSIVEELSDGGGKYRSGKQMLTVLLIFHQDIYEFVSHFSADIEAIFGIDATTWMYACKARWKKLLK